MTQNSSNQDFTNSADGFVLGGGTTERKLTVSGADIAITGSGANTYTMPSATDTLVGRTSTDTLTNKTLTSPALTTPTLGVATATSINKMAITAPATSSTLTVANGKTLTASNSLTLAGTDGTTMTMPASSDTLVGRASTDTLTNKDLSSATNVFPGTTLGYAQSTSSFSNSSTTAALITGLTTTVTIPTGGRRVKITLSGDSLQNNTSGSYAQVSIWEGSVGSGTLLAQAAMQAPGSNYPVPLTRIISYIPSSGSKTYSAGLNELGGGTAQVYATSTSPSMLLVELV